MLGSAAIEGPVISWVADHRKHHAFADLPGDPHSPHVDHGVGMRGTLRGLVHAHIGWLFVHDQRGARDRYAPDLLADPVMRFVDRMFPVWALGGLAAAFGLGFAIGGTVDAGLTALLWGGGVRLFLLHHVTYSINSICHVFGRRRFATPDESRNVFWLSRLLVRRVVAQQPPRVPDVGAPRPRRAGRSIPSALVIRGARRAPGSPGTSSTVSPRAAGAQAGTRGVTRRRRAPPGSSSSAPPRSSPGSRCC